jgi:hypothetical protein
MGEGNAIFAWQFKHVHYIHGWQNPIYWQYESHKSTLFMGGQMLNPYIKHGTFLVKFDDHAKTI